MAIDFTGIENVNEFYSHHYLNTILEKDLKDLFKSWSAQEKPPHSAINSLAGEYFRVKSKCHESPEDKWELSFEFYHKLFYPLGYELQRTTKRANNYDIPVIGEIKRSNGKVEVWIVEADDEGDCFAATIHDKQVVTNEEEELSLPQHDWADILSKDIFITEHPPRWILLVNMENIVLVDRSKWGQKKWLRFELNEIFGRKELSTIKAFSALIHKDNIAPDDGTCFLDQLDENSHKHAFAVSEDLKFGIRRAVELVANEYVYYNRERMKQRMYDIDLAEKLTKESLRYLYRLLFIFYVEARPELNFAPMKSEEYRKGYSLESLRDLELIPLTTDKAKNGYYIHYSIEKLFDLIYNGFPQQETTGQMHLQQEVVHNTFTINALKSKLFDARETPLLSKIKFRNSILQEIICLLSLSKVTKGKDRGRISYAQLGINQLGHVYEGLLSYTGFFAEEDLYEVKSASSKSSDDTEQAYFVPESELEKYKEQERVYEEDGSVRCYPKGTFIYRLSGRNREKSASYYTPEVLTKCLVKYALKDLLKDKSADEILGLTVCEPALGSGSFLNEAINQLAENYLSKKQKELDKTIDPQDYAEEKQKVKSFIAMNNVYGVDLNDMAIELAEVSIWLNTIYSGGSVPWFAMRFCTGNSLIGARRECFSAEDIQDSKKWLKKVPERLGNKKRLPHQIYHFLLPDSGMAQYKDKVVKKMVPEELQKIREWRKSFMVPFSKQEVKVLQQLSTAIDELWDKYTKQRQEAIANTQEGAQLWGYEVRRKRKMNIHEKDERIMGLNVPFGPFQRLKLVMDYWCALWFWPIEHADLLPTREEYLFYLQSVILGTQQQIVEPQQALMDWGNDQQMSFVAETVAPYNYVGKYGFTNVKELVDKVPNLRVVSTTAQKYRFMHWELQFADLFAERGGFDLVLGNPPWVRVGWHEAGLLSDFDARIAIRKFSSSKVASIRDKYLEQEYVKYAYLNEYVEFSGSKSFMSSIQNYPLLVGMKTNLYKCFVTKSWNLNSKYGFSSFIHPDGIYDDAKGKTLRKEVYQRTRYHFRFRNAFLLFSDIKDTRSYSINVYSAKAYFENTSEHIFNLFHPQTIDDSYSHSGVGDIPGIKDCSFNWNIKGHKHRIIHINNQVLELLNELFEREKDWMTSRLISLHSQNFISILKKFAKQQSRLSDLKGMYHATTMFDETKCQKEGLITKDTSFPDSINGFIVCGPHYFVGNPYNKMPRENCRHHQDYDEIDLMSIQDDFIPRNLFQPTEKFFLLENSQEKKKHVVGYINDKKITELYRYQNRMFVDPVTERTLIPVIYPPKTLHQNGSVSVTFQSYHYLLLFIGLNSSIVLDFIIKASDTSHVYEENLLTLPMPEAENFKLNIYIRTLRLNCLTIYYRELWDQMYQPQFQEDKFTKNDPRLRPFDEITSQWTRQCALRTPYERRQALVELDALAALALDLTLEELLTIYRVQFPVLQKYEAENHYDNNGLLVPREVLKQAKKQGIDISKPGETITYQDPKMYPLLEREYVTPFDTCNREDDMTQAYNYFKQKLQSQSQTRGKRQ